jgi:glycine oxidase
VIDYLVVGQGLAGTVFAWQAIKRGKRVLVVDREDEITSSKVAAGIINPITGKRPKLSWRFEELWPVASEFYRNCEAGSWHERPIIRLFRDEAEAEAWPGSLPTDFDQMKFDCRFGGFENARSGRLDVAEFLRRSREIFSSEGFYRQGEFEDFKDAEARFFVFCQGFEGSRNPLFENVPLRSGKGEILELRIPDFDEQRIVNRGKWLLPLGDEKFRAGSTFAWDDLTCEPTTAGRAEIEIGLREMLKVDYEITRAESAIRPMGFHGKPRLGHHPENPKMAYFNGLGSKGVLLAPYFAQQLLEHLEDEKPLDAEVDIAQFWK